MQNEEPHAMFPAPQSHSEGRVIIREGGKDSLRDAPFPLAFVSDGCELVDFSLERLGPSGLQDLQAQFQGK